MASGKMALAKLPPIESNSTKDISSRNLKKYEGLSGPTYQIGGTKHNLPPPNYLKPYVDTKSGALETWPAHATGQATSSTSVALTKNKELVLVDDEAMGKPLMVPKPRFLDQLEGFLKKELRSLGCTEVEPSDLRLQAHREVFEYLIEDFKTYKPLLSSIKNEYEMMLAFQRETIRQLEPLKQMLVTVSEQCDQKIMSLREQEKQEVLDLKQENRQLYQKIEDMRNEQNTLEAQVAKLQDDLSAEYHRYRDESDARKLLVSDINDLRYQQEDMMMSSKTKQVDQESEDDPITLKIALKKAREDETAATQRLNEMVADYGDVIPRRDFEALEKKHVEVMDTYEELQGDFDKLQQEHDTLLDVHKQVLQQRDDFFTECETLRRSATPRPDWSKCADHVQGGIVRWKEMSEGKTSGELVNVLLQEIAGGNVGATQGAEFFEAQGAGPSVPKYLRFEGQVRNRHLGKRDCALLIKDLWREKAASDAESEDGSREDMDEFLYMYLQRRFGIEQMIYEWSYNLHDACQRYAHDQKIGEFWRILTGQMDEEVYHANLQDMAKILNHLLKQDVENGNQGSLSREDLKGALAELFPHRDEESILMLCKAAELELELKSGDDVIYYKNLFMEDDEGRTGPFLDEIRKQQQQEQETYIAEIKMELADVNPIGVDDLRKALTVVDPDIDVNRMFSYMTWVFQVKNKEELESVEPLELSALISRLQNGNIFRPGRKM